MREDLQLEKLKNVCDIQPKKSEVKITTDDKTLVSFVPMKELGINVKFFSGNVSKALEDVYKGYTYFQDGDVILAKITPCFENGKLGIARNLSNGVGFGSSEFIPFRPKPNILDSEYLYYFLNQDSFRNKGSSLMQGAVGHKRVQPSFYENELIPLPSIIEQKKIVETLENIFTAIDQAQFNIKQTIQSTEDLFQSKLSKIFIQFDASWEERIWDDVLEIRSGRNQKSVESDSGTYPILGSAGKVMGYANDYICEENTVIIGRKGTINNPLYIKEKFWNVDTAFGLHALEDLDSKFLYYFCLSYDFTERDKGSGRPSLVKKDLLTMTMPIPSLDIQKDVVIQLDNFLEAINTLKESYKSKLSELEDLKQSILQKAFAGELLKDSPE